LITISIAVGALTTSCDSSDEIVSPPERWVLTMSDEFNSGTSPSAELWTIETGYGSNNDGWGNNEWQLYTDSPENVRVEDGNLVISAQCPIAPCGIRDGSITSARIKTQSYACDDDDKKCGFEQKYGRFEARIKLPEGQGLWPAFWMLGADIDEVGWPETGEIDIMEHLGQTPERVFGSLHGPGYSGSKAISRAFALPEGESFANDFHIFAVEWDPGRITFSVDEEVYNIVTSAQVSGHGDWVFDHEFFVILNLAVGGNPVRPPPDPSGTVFPAEMLVDYVRIFERAQ
jgi:beta-glucanase (GH16 family)